MACMRRLLRVAELEMNDPVPPLMVTKKALIGTNAGQPCCFGNVPSTSTTSSPVPTSGQIVGGVQVESLYIVQSQ